MLESSKENLHFDLVVFPSEKPISTILLLPGIPNFGISDKNGLIAFFNKNKSNFIYLDDKTYGEKLEDNARVTIAGIKDNQVENIDSKLPIFVVGLSYGGGVSIKLSDSKDIEHTIALSPLTQHTVGNIDWEYILNFIYKKYFTKLGLSSEKIREDIIDLVTIDDTKSLDRVSIYGIKQDEAIIIPDTYNSNILEEKDLGIKHFGLSKTGGLTEKNKEKIFETILQFNLARKIETDFIQECLDDFGEDNISGIMTHGTNAFNLKADKTSDFDFIVVLEKSENGNLQNINSILEKLRGKYNNICLDISFFYKETIEKIGFDYTVTSTHGPVYSMVFGYAKILYGKNIFKDSIKYFSDIQIRESFMLEIGKYVDRFNRMYLQNRVTPKNLKKYISRIIMCYLVGNKKLGIKNSNYFTAIDAISNLDKYFDNFEYKDLFLKVLSDKKLDSDDIGNSVDGLNIFLQQYGKLDVFSDFNLGKFRNKLRRSLKLVGYKNSIYIPPNFQKPKDITGISCLGFSELNCLNTSILLTDEQISKNMVMGLVISKLRKVIEDLYDTSIPVGFKIGDFGVSLHGDMKTNLFYIRKWQSYLEKELLNFLSGDSFVGRLSKDFRNHGEKTILVYEEPTISYDIFKKLLSSPKYNLPEEFVVSYLKKYFTGEVSESVLKIIYSSIKEHLELAFRMSTKWDSKIILFAGNAEKILLMSKILEFSKENTNILIGITLEKGR